MSSYKILRKPSANQQELTFSPHEFLHLKNLVGLKWFKSRATVFHTISYAALQIMFENTWNNVIIYSVYTHVVLLQELGNNINYGLMFFTGKSAAAKTIMIRYCRIAKTHHHALSCRVMSATLQQASSILSRVKNMTVLFP